MAKSERGRRNSELEQVMKVIDDTLVATERKLKDVTAERDRLREEVDKLRQEKADIVKQAKTFISDKRRDYELQAKTYELLFQYLLIF
jgi:hypothetical protein